MGAALGTDTADAAAEISIWTVKSQQSRFQRLGIFSPLPEVDLILGPLMGTMPWSAQSSWLLLLRSIWSLGGFLQREHTTIAVSPAGVGHG